jgi:FkbM family methyltransferase
MNSGLHSSIVIVLFNLQGRIGLSGVGMISLRGLGKPQYLFRPSILLRRLVQEVRPVGAREVVRLPWGLHIEVLTSDVVGMGLARQGLSDVVTTEVLWRLTNPGDTTIDVGANIGYFTSLLAIRVGVQGQVFAWEPHPETFRLLQSNVESWQEEGTCAHITLYQTALSNRDGMGTLSNFVGQEANTSYSFLTSQPKTTQLSVRIAKLEHFLNSSKPIQLMKVDAQWHEAQVLEGAGEHLRSGKIRDIVFEEESQFPARSHELLLSAGYEIFWFQERLLGPEVIPPTQSCSRRDYDIAPSYLATLDPDRALRLLSGSGWHSF